MQCSFRGVVAFGLILVVVADAQALPLRTETFDIDPGWSGLRNLDLGIGNNFGFRATNNTGVPGSVLVGGAGKISAILLDESVVEVFSLAGGIDVGDMKFDGAGRFIFSNDGTNGIFVSTGGTPTLLAGPFVERVRSMAIDDSDRIFADFTDGSMRVFNPDGSLADGAFMTSLSTGVANNSPHAFGPGGPFGTDLYVADAGNLLRVIFAEFSIFSRPAEIWFDMAGQSASLIRDEPVVSNHPFERRLPRQTPAICGRASENSTRVD